MLDQRNLPRAAGLRLHPVLMVYIRQGKRNGAKRQEAGFRWPTLVPQSAERSEHDLREFQKLSPMSIGKPNKGSEIPSKNAPLTSFSDASNTFF